MTIDRELLNEFLWTTREEVQRLETALLAIESGRREVETVNAVYRMFHSVKGAAGLCGIAGIETAAHHCESLLAPCRQQIGLLDPACTATLLHELDVIKTGLEDLAAGGDGATATPAAVASVAAAPTPAANPFDALIDDLGKAEAVKVAAKKPAASPKPIAAPVTEVRPTPVPVPAPSQPAAPAPSKSTPVTAKPAPSGNGEHPAAAADAAAGDTAVRVDVTLLDKLMNLVGELVLARNRLLQVVGRHDDTQLAQAAQSISQVTSEVQEHIVRTRMQPISNLFAKLPRLVRDLSRQLNKKIELETAGKDTELDRTILEALRDPFTHIIRNSCDHGIETEADRTSAGKPAQGTVRVRAWHEGGQVLVEIADDGRGINVEKVKAKAVANGLLTAAEATRMPDSEAFALICHPGLSTAEQVTSVSGRGVGMDVVKKNIEKLGGQLEITSVLGKGTTLRLHIPLTLAIIPALMVRVGEQIFGVPQVSLVELVRLDESHHVEHVRGAAVFRLRDQLLTLVHLAEVLGVPRGGGGFIAVLADGRRRFGLVVDAILDTEEIVVKPLSRLLAGPEVLAGATIRGDGRVALILDIAGVAHAANIDQAADQVQAKNAAAMTDMEDFLVFDLGHRERFAVPLSQVQRIERHPAGDLASVDGREVLCHDGALRPVVRIEAFTHATAMTTSDADIHAIVVSHQSGAALLARNVVDNCSLDVSKALPADRLDPSDAGVLGALVIDNVPTVILDVGSILDRAFVHAHASAPESVPSGAAGHGLAAHGLAAHGLANGHAAAGGAASGVILYCEDSQFFQKTVVSYLRELGYTVDVHDDGQQGWQSLEKNPDRYGLVLTDLEMPVLDGWGLIKQIRDFPHYDRLPVIALSSLNDEAVKQRVMQLGATRYLTKLDKAKLSAAITEHLALPASGVAQ